MAAPSSRREPRPAKRCSVPTTPGRTGSTVRSGRPLARTASRNSTPAASRCGLPRWVPGARFFSSTRTRTRHRWPRSSASYRGSWQRPESWSTNCVTVFAQSRPSRPPDAYELAPGDDYSSQFGPVRENGSGLDTEGEVTRSQFHFLWPNTMINIFPGRTNLSIGPVLPAGSARTERFLDYFFGPEVEAAWIDELLEFDEQVGAEDKVLVENVQRGVATGLIERGRLLPESERLIVDFQQRIRGSLA
ncbi:MAG: hypothetical protein E6G19_06595 [Actinobacteria bacterium]|nr:MAG: hypothetical protein E6G19_06595 [Actinomycetota bacterium]